MAKEVTGQPSIEYVVAGAQVFSEYNDGVLTRSYAYGRYVDEPIATWNGDASETLYYHHDHRYSVEAITNASGQVVERYGYTSYGKAVVLDGAGTEVDPADRVQPYGYTGRRYDSETGLWYFRARYFDADLGRFISRDPLTYVDGMSMYRAYFAPRGIDPSGTEEYIPSLNEMIPPRPIRPVTRPILAYSPEMNLNSCSCVCEPTSYFPANTGFVGRSWDVPSTNISENYELMDPCDRCPEGKKKISRKGTVTYTRYRNIRRNPLGDFAHQFANAPDGGYAGTTGYHATGPSARMGSPLTPITEAIRTHDTATPIVTGSCTCSFVCVQCLSLGFVDVPTDIGAALDNIYSPPVILR